jgi:DNA-binding transcriptional ArsR family regulator
MSPRTEQTFAWVPSDSVVIVFRMTRDHVRRLLAEGLSLAEVARTLALSKSTVSHHARRLGIEPDTRFARRYDWSVIRRFYEEGHTVAECRERFGFDMSTWADALRRGDIVPLTPKQKLEAYGKRGRPLPRASLKRLLIDAGLKREACERCGIDEWRGRRLSIALHHVNGDPGDNRLENIQFLCPNCHSQTENYGGRNRPSVRMSAATNRRGAAE